MSALMDRLAQAVNGHDLEGLVSCFADDYVHETPVHPRRGFLGNDQVRTNWTQILAGVPDIEAAVLRRAESDDRVWTEWEMSGTRFEGHGPRIRPRTASDELPVGSPTRGMPHVTCIGGDDVKPDLPDGGPLCSRGDLVSLDFDVQRSSYNLHFTAL